MPSNTCPPGCGSDYSGILSPITSVTNPPHRHPQQLKQFNYPKAQIPWCTCQAYADFQVRKQLFNWYNNFPLRVPVLMWGGE